MFRYSNWRLAILYALLILVTALGLVAYWRVADCSVQDVCFTNGLWVALALIVLLVSVVTLWITGRQGKTLHELVEMAHRISGGELSARVLLGSSGKDADLVRAVNDMTDRLRGEVRLLSEENEQLSIVFENMADGALITDALGRVLLINSAAARLLDYDLEKAYGRSYAEVVRHYKLIELWQQCREEGLEAVSAVETGRNLFLQAYVTPFEERGARGYLIILQDLTQVRFLQTVRRDFVSNISHELRSPLAALRAIVETLEDGALEEQELAHHFLERADGELDAMTQMVEELLELSRIESGEVPLRLAATAIEELVELPVMRIQPQAERKGITVLTAIPPELPRALADAERMQRVVANLLHNALKFTDPGGEILVSARIYPDRPEELVVSVQDSGVGIAPDDVDRIFERFYKSDRARTRSRGGTGLGLAIARHTVEAHGGQIWVKSKEGKGSTFYFSIPVADAAVNSVLTRP